MNKNTLAVLAVIVALLAGWMVMKNLNAPSANMPEASSGPAITDEDFGNKAPEDVSNGNQKVDTTLNIDGPNIKTSIDIE